MPKVFVSHASEDKERFVVDLATRLRARGIDAWLDKWEMFPGDSRVDKIFEEGLKDATAVIIVLSANSIAKPWVREELNASVVQRISKGTKVIPIVIDDCEVPTALTSTLYVKIRNTGAYDSEFERVVASILGITDKPPLGDLPGYASSPIDSIGGLAQVDSALLRLACDEALTSTGLPRLLVNHIFNRLSNAGLIKKSSSIGGTTHVVEKSPELRRHLAHG